MRIFDPVMVRVDGVTRKGLIRSCNPVIEKSDRMQMMEVQGHFVD